MRAARVCEKGRIEVAEVPEPEPAEGEVLLRVRQCGICGSDLHAFRNGWTDHPLGHEMSAVVAAAGPGVTALAPGAHVCAECYSACGECESCARGARNLCNSLSFMGGRKHGAMAEMVALPAASVYALPGSFSDVQALMVEPLAVALRAVRRAGAAGGRSVSIIGAGTIGLLCAAAARAEGAGRVTVLAKHPHQAEAAEALGADAVALLGRQKPVDALRGGGQAPDAVIDTVALGTSFSNALAAVRKGGRVVLVGEVTRPLLAALAPLLHGEVEVTGSFCYAGDGPAGDFPSAIDLIARGAVDVARLVTHTLPFDRLEEAFEVAADKSTGCIKVVVDVTG